MALWVWLTWAVVLELVLVPFGNFCACFFSEWRVCWWWLRFFVVVVVFCADQPSNAWPARRRCSAVTPFVFLKRFLNDGSLVWHWKPACGASYLELLQRGVLGLAGLLNPFGAPEPLPILNPSDFVPKNGFPVVKGWIPLHLETRFWDNLLGICVGKGFGALKGL